MANPWLVRPALSEDAPSVTELFERADVPCFCQYYQFVGDHREWQNRCANDRASNRTGLALDLAEARTCAVIAVREETVLGWLRVAPAEQLGKLYDNRLYRAIPVLREGDRRRAFAVSCFLVDPNWRRRGVARELLQAGIEAARGQGASMLEAFPRGADDVSDAEQWMGPRVLYEELGFQRIVDFAPYPVYRLDFAGPYLARSKSVETS